VANPIPKSTIRKVMGGRLPPDMQVAKSAVVDMQAATIEFIESMTDRACSLARARIMLRRPGHDRGTRLTLEDVQTALNYSPDELPQPVTDPDLAALVIGFALNVQDELFTKEELREMADEILVRMKYRGRGPEGEK